MYVESPLSKFSFQTISFIKSFKSTVEEKKKNWQLKP